MRRPVASIFALAEDALAEPGLPQPTRTRLEQIVEEAEWLTDLIQQSVHAAGPDAPGPTQADLFRVVNEVVAAERVTWPGDVKVLGLAGPVLCAVHCVLLRRMVANLLSNATRAAGPSGSVTIELGGDRHLARLAIEDTGPGFGKIERGLGLGLPGVSRCAAAYGGGLDHGCGASGGARVSLWLPRITEPVRDGCGGSEFSSTLSRQTRKAGVPAQRHAGWRS
jgi:signal transduction histidine kinase